MKITYDKDVDAVYIELSGLKPEGVIEVADGINIDVSPDGRIVGIELLDATEKVSLESLLSYEISAETLREWGQAKEDEATRMPGWADLRFPLISDLRGSIAPSFALSAMRYAICSLRSAPSASQR